MTGFRSRRERKSRGVVPGLLGVMLALLEGSGICSSPAGAADRPGGAVSDNNSPSWLSGDWGGARLLLRNAGIDLQLGYVGETAGNATGGLRRQAAYADQWTAGVTLDLGRLGLAPGGAVQVTVTDRNGSSLSEDAGLGALQAVQEIFGRGQTARLTQFWYSQKFVDDRIEWKVGRMPFSEEFSAFACDFQNLTFCGTPAGNIAGGYIYNWPISQWATRLKIDLPGFGYVKFAAFDQNPKYLGLQDALLPAIFSGSTGVLLPLELAWTPHVGGAQGSYKFGGWYDTSTFQDVGTPQRGVASMSPTSPAPEQRGRWGAYVNFVQQLTHHSGIDGKRGLSVFFNATVTDPRSALTDTQVAGGLVFTGPFQARPSDDIGVAVGTTHLNGRMAWASMVPGGAGVAALQMHGSEYVVETYYTYRPRAGLDVRPNVQFVAPLGGYGQTGNAWVFGLKTVASF